MRPTLPAPTFSALQTFLPEALKAWDPALPKGIQTLLGEETGLALLSPPPVPHALVPLQVTRGLIHTKQVPSDHLEGSYPYTGQGGEGGARGIG